jgi:hypothetical protein
MSSLLVNNISYEEILRQKREQQQAYHQQKRIENALRNKNMLLQSIAAREGVTCVSLNDYESWLSQNKATLHSKKDRTIWNRYTYMEAYCKYLKYINVATEPSTTPAPSNIDAKKWNLLRTICNERQIRFDLDRFNEYSRWIAEYKNAIGSNRYKHMVTYCDVLKGNNDASAKYPIKLTPVAPAALTPVAPVAPTTTAPVTSLHPEVVEMRKEQVNYALYLLDRNANATGAYNKITAAIDMFRYINTVPSLIASNVNLAKVVAAKAKEFEDKIATDIAHNKAANILGAVADLRNKVNNTINSSSPVHKNIITHINNMVRELELYNKALENTELLEVMKKTKEILNKHAKI